MFLLLALPREAKGVAVDIQGSLAQVSFEIMRGKKRGLLTTAPTIPFKAHETVLK